MSIESDIALAAELTRLRAQQTAQEAALRIARKELLIYMEGEGFDEAQDDSGILDVIDAALATLDVPDPKEEL